MEPLDKNDKTPLMLAQSHRHNDIVELLHTEKKRRSSWFPPLNEVWGLLFGKAGNSKAPLIFFMSSVLLWGYPMYVIRVSIIIMNYVLYRVAMGNVNISFICEAILIKFDTNLLFVNNFELTHLVLPYV